MIKVKVVSVFRDKFHYKTIYNVGDIEEFDEARARDLIERGLAVPFEEKAKVAEPKTKGKSK